MTSCDPAPRDIWLAYVEFADHEGVGKVRPVVILDASGKASVITAKITASANYEPSSFVEISDWESCGLRRPSCARSSAWTPSSPPTPGLHAPAS